LSSRWWRIAAWGILLALAGAVGALLFVAVMVAGLELLWPDEMSPEAFTGPWRAAIILTVAGFIVGLIRLFSTNAEKIDVFGGLVEGRIEPASVPSGVAISLVSLIGGFSLGPEAPTGMLAGGMATKVAEMRGANDERRRAGVLAGVSGAWGGFFTSPFVSVLLALELMRFPIARYWPIISIQIVGAIVGFFVFFAVGGWADVLRLFQLPAYDLELWHFPVAVLMGALGAALGVLFIFMSRLFTRLAEAFGDHVVLRCTLAGALLGGLGMALPLTLFQGTEGLVQITSDPEEVGLTLITISGLAKLLATSAALRFGFVGGPILPLLFVGGCLGEATHLIVPGIPEGLAVAAGMAAVPSGVVAIPLSIGVLVVLIAAVPMVDSSPVLTASVASFLLVRGLGIGRTADAG
jgi:H+/Cl- antiporter ClcA